MVAQYFRDTTFAQLALVACILCSSPALASPWGQQDGAVLVITRVDYFRARLSPLTSQNANERRRFERFETNNYVEFGLSGRTTLGAKVVYGSSTLTTDLGPITQSGFSEIEIFSQRSVRQSQNSIVGIQFTAGVPASFGSGVRDTLSNDGVDLELSGLFGVTLANAPLKVFAAAESGFRKRTGAAADQLNSQLTIGIEPNDRWLLLADLFSTISTRNERAGGADFDIVKIQPALVYRASNRWSFELGVNQEILGRNVATGRTIFVGLWSRF